MKPENVAATMSGTELLALVNEARKEFGEAVIRANVFAERIKDELDGEYYKSFVVQNLNNTLSTVFELTRDQCMLVSMRESKAVRRKVVAKLNALDAAARSIPMASKLAGEMAIMECYTRLLKPAPSSQIMMLAKISQNNGLDSNFLPAYAVDAATDSTDGSSMPTKALTALLRDHGIKMSAAAFNVLLGAGGYLKRLTRNNTKKEVVEFWSVTELGLRFGKNLTSPNNPRETQPHWYVDRFADLAREVGA
ncbi:MAG: Rha family transcriptional regulator [Pseudomonadaceae bacterium]|nr:Rha family transcriptional regulator [Pseudomonadaceae bacterium]